MVRTVYTFLVFTNLLLFALAHVTPMKGNRPHAARQNPTNTVTVSTPPLTQISSGMPTETPQPLFTSFAPGASPPVTGAAPLPTIAIDPSKYPQLDEIPPTTGPELQPLLAKLKAAKIPDIKANKDAICESNPDAVAKAGPDANCWWTCGGCLREKDVSVCPDKNTWGVSFDDGPSDYTPKLLNYLDQKNVKATFFVVGSRVISRPAVVQAEYMLGHGISVHTWSHPALTTLTNEQIVAELGWTMIAIKNVIGVTPNTFRPPFGDLDDRVRAVAAAIGLTPLMWTGSGEAQFDTDDFAVGAGTVTSTESLNAFKAILDKAASLATGFIVLEHDLYQQTIDLAIGYFLPLAAERKFTVKSISECRGEAIENIYIETSKNGSSPSSPSGTNNVTTSGISSGTSKASGIGTPTNAGQASPSNSGAACAGPVGGIIGLGGQVFLFGSAFAAIGIAYLGGMLVV